MCVICISPAGVPQPSRSDIIAMYRANPHGAGYMVAEGERVRIEKGFMNCGEFLDALDAEGFGPGDPVVYHFRISTQAGICPEMTQPFPWSPDLRHMRALSLTCKLGIAHNGIIPCTSTGDPEYSDTALFIAGYLSKLVKGSRDLHDPKVQSLISSLAKSKLALLERTGQVTTIGNFTEEDGILYSNMIWTWRNLQPAK